MIVCDANPDLLRHAISEKAKCNSSKQSYFNIIPVTEHFSPMHHALWANTTLTPSCCAVMSFLHASDMDMTWKNSPAKLYRFRELQPLLIFLNGGFNHHKQQ